MYLYIYLDSIIHLQEKLQKARIVKIHIKHYVHIPKIYTYVIKLYLHHLELEDL